MIKVLFHYCVVVFVIVESCPSGTKKDRQIPTGTTKYIKPDSGSGHDPGKIGFHIPEIKIDQETDTKICFLN